MPSTLIRGRQVICRVSAEGEPEVVEDGAVLVRDAVVETIGPFSRLERECDYQRILGGPDHVVFPGLVNAHHHIGVTPLQHGSPDLPLELAKERSVPMHMHLLETAYQKAYALERCGRSAVEHLQALEMLGPLLTLGHGVWTTADDLQLLAESGTHVCHNCSSNFRLRSGTAPVNAMLELGIGVAIGIDEAGMNDDRDMLQELRMVLRTHRAPGMDTRVPSAAEVFRMGSEHGALTTGFGEHIGVLAPGRAADLVAIRYDRLSFPYLDADVPVIDALVQRGRPQHVDLVMVAGETVLEAGELTRIDERAALAELAASLSVPPSEAELERRRVSRAARPYVEAFYRNYLDAIDPQPFYRMSSKR